MMMILLMAFCGSQVFGQNEQQTKTDTVIVSLGKTSKVIFTMEDRKDLEILRHYNFQELFQDILTKIENNGSPADTSKSETSSDEPSASAEEEKEEQSNEDESWRNSEEEKWRDDDDDDDDSWREYRHNKPTRIRRGRTWQSFNFDLGTNNYLSDGRFKDTTYSVRPWGSWYLAATTTQRTRVGKNVFFEWGLGVSWYNFKFQDDNVFISKTDNGVTFTEDTRDVNAEKSKLTVTYINASFIPVLDLGGYNKKPRMWNGYRSAFRIGLGPYVGYRIASRSKYVYSDAGDREKEKERSSFYLNNLRYGARLQLGFHGTDLFFNYDMNELFQENRGPKLNAFSFGIIF